MDGYVTIGTKLDTKSFDAQIDYVKSQLDDIEDKLKQADMGFEVGDVQKLEAQYEKLSDKLRNLIKKKEEFNKEKMFDFSGVQQSVEGVGKSVQKVTRRIGKMAIAVFGIRSAFMFVRNAINTIASDDTQLRADIDYMKSALAYTLEPLVRGIVNLAKQLMFYIGYIVKAWFGINIFENANKSLNNANKEAKKLSKTMAGFDEMNVLQDNSSTSSEGIAIPSFDLTAPEDYPIPGWIKWIADNGDTVASILSGIGTALLAVKLGFSGIQALGIGIAVAGIVRSIQKIIDFIKKPTFKNFMGILEGIAITVIGIGTSFAAWPVAIGGAVALIIIELVNHFEKVKDFFKGLINWISNDFTNMMIRVFGPFGHIIAGPIEGAVKFIRDIFEGLVGGIRKVIDGILTMFKGDFVGGITKVFDGLGDILKAPFKALNDFVNSTFTGIVNFIIDMINVLIDALNKISFKVPDWVPGIGGKKFGVNIKRLTRIGEEKRNGGGGGFRAKGGIFYPSKLPKLALGGIINQPGRGVPYHGAYIGERGAEAVVPLTDSQQMALLGETIGRYITVELTNITKLDGRQIARKVDKVQQSNDFVFNR